MVLSLMPVPKSPPPLLQSLGLCPQRSAPEWRCTQVVLEICIPLLLAELLACRGGSGQALEGRNGRRDGGCTRQAEEITKGYGLCDVGKPSTGKYSQDRTW